MSATIKDIAKAAGVSISTVSRVLTSSQTVDQEKKERVMKAVREMNYVPNSNARNLRKTQSQTVMILAKTIENPFFRFCVLDRFEFSPQFFIFFPKSPHFVCIAFEKVELVG